MLGGIPIDVLKIQGRRSHCITLALNQYSTTATEIATPSSATVILLWPIYGTHIDKPAT